MNVDTLRKQLDDRNLKVVAERIGVNYMTLLRFYSGETKKPSFEMVETIAKYLGE